MLTSQVDERHIPSFRIMHQGKDTVGEGAQEDHHYPFAGKENPKVWMVYHAFAGHGARSAEARLSATGFRRQNRRGVITERAPPLPPLETSGWGKQEKKAEIYLARVNWLQDGSLFAQVENRAQTELRLLRLDAQTGAATTLLVEKSKIWVNLHHLLRPLPAAPARQQVRTKQPQQQQQDGTFSFIWASERSGFMHLYLYEYVPGADEAVEIRQITSGEWVVEYVVGVDQ
ncbi:unnamed protein product, partial [Hapterophycus canaliculatus]